MSSSLDASPPSDATSTAYERGRRAGLAIGSLAVGLVAFISLLGLEKAILAGVLGMLALRGDDRRARYRRWAKAALIVSVIYAATWLLVVVLFHDKLFELLQLLQKLG